MPSLPYYYPKVYKLKTFLPCLMKTRRKNEYITIKLPRELAKKCDEYVDTHSVYTSRTDFIKQAIRTFLEKH